MAAPPVTAHVVPSGFKMPDGFRTVITFANNTAVQLWVESVKPPGFDGGEKIPTTTMENNALRTFDARKLKTYTDANFKAMLDPDAIPSVQTLINWPGGVTVKLPDSSSWSFWAYLQKAEFDEFEEGKPPMLTGTIAVTNWDPNLFVEAGPVYTPAAGT